MAFFFLAPNRLSSRAADRCGLAQPAVVSSSTQVLLVRL